MKKSPRREHGAFVLLVGICEGYWVCEAVHTCDISSLSFGTMCGTMSDLSKVLWALAFMVATQLGF